LQSGAHLAHDGGVVVFAQIVAVLVYLVPVVVVVVLSARRERGLGDFAVLVPAAVAVDLLFVLLLCRVVRLEWAAFISRGLWLAGGALWFDRRQRRHGLKPARPAALDGRAIAGIAMAMLAAAALSAVLSRPNAIWDRELHIPFVASLRGQQMPFASPYEPGAAFHYHFSGDVLASMLQIFSFDVLNASLALSLAHDVMFALIGLATALALLASGPKPAHVVVLSVVAVLLSGPCVLRFGVGEPYLGYSYYALYIWGFRPHQHVAMLMFVGIATRLLFSGPSKGPEPPAMGADGQSPSTPARSGRNQRSEPAAPSTTEHLKGSHTPSLRSGVAGGNAALVAMVGLLAVTDETSAGMIGLCLGIAWLFDPELLAPTRRRGLLLFGALLLAFVATNLVFSASLAPGGPVQNFSLVAPRSPGVQQPPLPLSTGAGLVALVADTLPVWAILLAIVLITARRGQRGQEGARPRRGLIAFAAALAGFSILGLTTSDVNGGPPESHRFLTVALFVFPLVGVLCLDPWWRPGTLGRTLVLAALMLGAGSTVLWLSHYRRHPTPESYFRQRGKNLHTSDCRAVAGARFGQRPTVSYVEASVFYAYAGCRPSFVAGRRATSYWTRKEYPTLGLAGFQQLDREMLAADAPVDAVCPTGRRPGDTDPVCTYALARPGCVPEGSDYVRCPLAPGDRRAIAGGQK